MKDIYLTSEATRAYRKRYYQKNREAILQRQRERNHDDPEKDRERAKRYGMTHDRSDYFREYYRKKKELKKNLKNETAVLSS